MLKLLVIDKCVFQQVQESLLIEFVKHHNVVLPHVLLVECLMSDDLNGSKPAKDRMVLLSRIEKVVKSGAQVGYSSSRLFQEERRTLSQVHSVIDLEGTRQVRDSILSVDGEYAQSEAAVCRDTFEPLVRFLFDIGTTYYRNVEKNNQAGNFRREFQANTLIERLSKWLRVVEQMKDAILENSFGDISCHITESWFAWHMVELYWVWGIEWACKRAQSGIMIEDRDISNDLFDIEYVAYLSRADGILTQDKKLVIPLAQAAFPDKDVFFDLDEVPDEYACR